MTTVGHFGQFCPLKDSENPEQLNKRFDALFFEDVLWILDPDIDFGSLYGKYVPFMVDLMP